MNQGNVNRENKHLVRSHLITRTALWMAGVGLLLLLGELATSIYHRLQGEDTFASTSNFSGTDGYRIIAIIAFVAACAFVYTLNKVGKVMGLILAAVVMWEIAMWYSVYQNLGESSGRRDLITMGIIGLLTAVFFVLNLLSILPKHKTGVDHGVRPLTR